jgi:NADH-ubiquinone oxidoreductase chain 6
MLINVRISELLSNTSNSIPLAIIIAISYNYPIHQILPYSIAAFNSYTINLGNVLNDMEYTNYSSYFNNFFKFIGVEQDNSQILFVTSKVWDSYLSETTHISSIGNIMYTSYSI